MALLHFEFEKYDLTLELEVDYTLSIVQSSSVNESLHINIVCDNFTCIRAYDGDGNKVQEHEIKDVIDRDKVTIVRKAHNLILEQVEL